ncbi:peptide MFS transporter [Prevotella corporis]|uniref:peptide MFS transporter n=1 Tax=Prevotella corporis TaxID=28128 RepID=UPI0023F03F6B|nr:peptide MFS transporter [Prevotella corporis]
MFKNHPKGLLQAALSNMGERFGYYIMIAVLALFLCSKFGLSDETSGLIASLFLAAIYVMSLVGGIIADKTQNYQRTIESGLVIMALGYIALSFPVMITPQNNSFWLGFTIVALALISFGNGLFKGNLQAIVGQMYDNFETEAAKVSPEKLKWAQGQRDAGFQIFYVFINIGSLVAPFLAPMLRSWWLGTKGFTYNADLPKLCHDFINGNIGNNIDNLRTLTEQVGGNASDLVSFCPQYLDAFNTGIHYSFIVSVLMMLVSLAIFVFNKRKFPMPGKKAETVVEQYTEEEKATMAKEIKQRMYALFAVLGISVFFWFSFHQNGQSLSFFARDFVKTDSIAPEIWQCVNPFFVISLTPVVMWIFAYFSKKGNPISTPKKIAYGMGIAGMAYIFLMIISLIYNYPSAETFTAMDPISRSAAKAAPWILILTYFFLTVAELFISPLGLSFVSKVAPKHLQGLCQGLWLGATAVGNLLLWVGPLMYNKWPIWECWLVFAIVCGISMIVMFSMVKWLERVTEA